MTDEPASPLKTQPISSHVVGGVLAVIIAVAAISIYEFYRVDRVQESVGVGNQFYVPVLKHLNMVSGKWAAYQRTFESSVSFRKWGSSSEARSSTNEARPDSVEPGSLAGTNAPEPRLHLHQMLDADLAELALRAEQRAVPEAGELKVLVDSLLAVADREPGTLASIEASLKTKNYADAAALYMRARQEHLAVTRDLAQLSRDIEARLALLQLSAEQELRGAQAAMVLLIGGCLLSSVVVLFRVRRWLRPIVEWTRVAQEIALKGIHRDVKFPAVRREMPPEIALLTREFTRMGMTVIERERTIHQQKQKVESLNNHLKDQNLMLRRLGGLNERVLNSMSSGLLVIGGDGMVEQFNERYCELFGVERASLLGKTARAALAGWPTELVEHWLAAFMADEPLTLSRLPLGPRVFDVRVQLLHEGSGRLLMFEDVSGLVAAEAKLEHARRLVLAGNLSSQVAHEVRNPLNSMSLQLEMLQEDLTLQNLQPAGASAIESCRSRVTAVSEQVERLDRITRRYLDVGRPRAGARREPVDLNELVESCIRFLSGEIQACGAEVALELADDCVIAGDADGVSQVLFNLVRNALEALKGQETPRRLVVKTARTEAVVRCVVSDSGPGIDQQLRSRLFEPFVTNKATGHGLGLSVSRQICIDHGGELRTLPTDGGAAFEFSLGAFAGGADA